MKTLSLSSIAFLFLCLFYSCTKDSSTRTSQQSSETLSGTQAGRNVVGNDNSNPQGGNDNVAPAMTITYSPLINSDPATASLGQEITVTGSLTGSSIPDCGKLELQQWVNGTWASIPDFDPVDVTTANHQIVYTFTPDVAGTYQFRVHYIKGGCPDFGNSLSDGFSLIVVEACNGLDITGKVVGDPEYNATTGLYKFTVVYEVSTCGLEFNKLKVQGGLTNGVSDVNAEDGNQRPPGSSTNKIITWEEQSTPPSTMLSTQKRTYTITFEKAYSGSGTIELTGDWSVSVSLIGGDEQKDTFAKIYYTK